jgi:hypothetical protein
LDHLLSNISRATPVVARIDGDDGEWTLLTSAYYPADKLYKLLSSGWARIVPQHERQQFALVHCQQGPNAGVWLHNLATPSLRAGYDVGCYEIDSW